MSEIQTRRGVSLNRVIFDAAKKQAAIDGVTLAEFITELIRFAVPGLPEIDHRHRSDIEPPPPEPSVEHPLVRVAVRSGAHGKFCRSCIDRPAVLMIAMRPGAERDYPICRECGERLRRAS